MSDWEEDDTVGVGVGPARDFNFQTPSYTTQDNYDNEADIREEKNDRRGNFSRGGGRSYGQSGYGRSDEASNEFEETGDSNSYGSESRNSNSRYRGGRNGGGNSRFNGGGDGFDNSQDQKSDHGSDYDGSRFRGGRGRGGRGRGGRGGGRRFDNGDSNYDGDKQYESRENGEGEPQKPRELYIPPEPSENESDMFGSGISTGINFSKYDKIDVKVSGVDVPPPISSFDSAGLRSIVIENINNSKYTVPTPIQKYTLPIVMAGRDVMGCAQTGSGKTASFLIPIINTILANPELIVEGDHIQPQCIIVTPTRELTIQIYSETKKFSHRSVLKVCMAYGGTGVRYQSERLMMGCHILVATPGRLMDFLRRGRIQLCSIKFIVLDEADRMLDMGFFPEMEKLMTHSSLSPVESRQTLMFSATFAEDVQRTASKFLNDYIFVAVGIVGGACSDVDQMFHEVERFKKKDKLKEILREDENHTGVIVFVETRRNADFIAALLSEQGIPTTSIHGDRLQREREEALRDFKQGTRGILVATGVASRGLDIKNVRHVINFDLPKSIDEYVHRIGRTGRVGNKGKATSFYDDSQDRPLAGDLVKILTDAGQPIPDFLQNIEVGGFNNDTYGGRDMRGDNFGGGQACEAEEEW